MDNESNEKLYNEACRMVGQCVLMLAQNGVETSRGQISFQLSRLQEQYKVIADEPNLAIELAIEQLEESN